MKDDSQRRGKTFYYADYRLGGGRKVYYECSFALLLRNLSPGRDGIP